MKIDINRIKNDIEVINGFNATPYEGITRVSYSKEEKKAREYLFNVFSELGLSVRTDAVGNIRAKLGDSLEPSIILGSHIDTVRNGGKFDGLLGVCVAIEVVRLLKDISLKYPIEIVVFAEEEGSNFNCTCLGSKSLIGKLNINDLKELKDVEGLSAFEVLNNYGLSPENIENDILNTTMIKAMLEMHIEQSIILDDASIPIGIVTGVFGVRSYDITLIGEANHAGSTPMHLRKDTVMAFCEIGSHIERIVKEYGSGNTVATIGLINTYPGSSNVIAGRLKFTIDIRDVKDEYMYTVENEIFRIIKTVCDNRKIEGNIVKRGTSNGVMLSENIIRVIEDNVKLCGYGYKKFNSGATHDAALIAEIADVGMIFIRSKDGISHSKHEYSYDDDIEIGAQILLDTVLKIEKGE